MPIDDIKNQLIDIFAQKLYIPKDMIEEDDNIMNLGVDSILSVEIVQEVNARFGTELLASMIYDYPTIKEFSAYVQENASFK